MAESPKDILMLDQLSDIPEEYRLSGDPVTSILKSFSSINKTYLKDETADKPLRQRFAHILMFRYFNLLRAHLDASTQVKRLLGSEELWQKQLKYLIELPPYLKLSRSSDEDIDFEQLFCQKGLPQEYRGIISKNLPVDPQNSSFFCTVGGVLYKGKAQMLSFTARSDFERSQKELFYRDLVANAAGFNQLANLPIDSEEVTSDIPDFISFGATTVDHPSGLSFQDLVGSFSELTNDQDGLQEYDMVFYPKVPVSFETILDNVPLAPILMNTYRKVTGAVNFFTSEQKSQQAIADRKAALKAQEAGEHPVGFKHEQLQAQEAQKATRTLQMPTSDVVDAQVPKNTLEGAPKPFGDAPFISPNVPLSMSSGQRPSGADVVMPSMPVVTHSPMADVINQGPLPSREEAMARFHAQQAAQKSPRDQGRPPLNVGSNKPDTEPPLQIKI